MGYGHSVTVRFNQGDRDWKKNDLATFSFNKYFSLFDKYFSQEQRKIFSSQSVTMWHKSGESAIQAARLREGAGDFSGGAFLPPVKSCTLRTTSWSHIPTIWTDSRSSTDLLTSWRESLSWRFTFPSDQSLPLPGTILPTSQDPIFNYDLQLCISASQDAAEVTWWELLTLSGKWGNQLKTLLILPDMSLPKDNLIWLLFFRIRSLDRYFSSSFNFLYFGI